MIKVLYFGTLDWGSTSLQRLEGLRAAGAQVYGVDQRIFAGEYLRRSPWQRLQMRLGRGPLPARISRELVREARRYRPQVVWVDSGLCVSQEALRRIKETTQAFCVHYTPDSLVSPGLGNACFIRALPEYDLCITTKAREEGRYYRQGARRVWISQKGYDPGIHRPLPLSPAEQEQFSCQVAFAGERMEARAQSLCRLVARLPVRINLYGRDWDRGRTGAVLAWFDKGWVYGEDYAKALGGAQIALGFLNREVGDTDTTRSLEIPACGAFLLAERTDRHLELFREDREAAFFSSDEELIDKVQFYLAHDTLRQRIARAGYERVQKLDLTWAAVMQRCLAAIARIARED